MKVHGPYLSVVLTGRNDNYGGDFNERFLRALGFNHRHLAEAGIDYEVVFVEWAPVAGRPYLAELLAEQLPEMASTIRTFVVDARYQETASLNPSVRFLEFSAKNVGIRRARGAFVLSTNTDVHLSRGIVEILARRELAERTLYRATRADLKLGSDLTHLDWDLLEDERNHAEFVQIRPPLYPGASGDFQLLDRASWHQLRGFNEIYRLARWGIDWNFQYKAYTSGYRIMDIGPPVYHLNHVGSVRISRSIYSDRRSEAPWGAQKWRTAVMYENPETWGLARAPARALAERVDYLDFAWDAVPPLVELRRVLRATSREGQESIAKGPSAWDRRRAGPDRWGRQLEGMVRP